MSPIVRLYDRYINSLKNCYYFQQQNENKKLLNEIGTLRGLADALDIYNVGVKNVEYEIFLQIEKNLLK